MELAEQAPYRHAHPEESDDWPFLVKTLRGGGGKAPEETSPTGSGYSWWPLAGTVTGHNHPGCGNSLLDKMKPTGIKCNAVSDSQMYETMSKSFESSGETFGSVGSEPGDFQKNLPTVGTSGLGRKRNAMETLPTFSLRKECGVDTGTLLERCEPGL